MTDSKVSLSRAGDAFHYRWAARRCLKLISFKSQLKKVLIESSLESKLPGELVIDLSEYYGVDIDIYTSIHYIQLKHSLRKTNPFTLSELQKTISDFTKRYTAIQLDSDQLKSEFMFKIVSNRKISSNIKNTFNNLSNGKRTNTKIVQKIMKMTGLDYENLKQFSRHLYFEDEEGDYLFQREALRSETAKFISSTPDTPLIDSLITLVSEAVLPNARENDKYIITRETILARFGITSEYYLFPAPPQYEEIENIIHREQFTTLKDIVFSSTSPVLIHAEGGVGKSVFATYCIQSLPNQSFGVLYDCFGGGKYRSISESRHRHRDALVQIINELAVEGLCDPFIPLNTDQDSKIVRIFLTSLSKSVSALKNADNSAFLLIIIDAADNAEMAAKERKDDCFVHELLLEEFPDDCKLLILGRTERINLLQLPDNVKQIELHPFSEEESYIHLKQFFPQASHFNGSEFHRLTNSGNPRVQATAMNNNYSTVDELLLSFGPSGISLDDQIAEQIGKAVSQIKNKYTKNVVEQINLLCHALGSLPPFIPIDVLSAITEIDKSMIKSFLSDIGRSLWITDNSIQFRDEPTETWFRNIYAADNVLLNIFLDRIKLITTTYSYAAQVLPILLLKTEQYNDLVNLALSDEYLPGNNSIEQRTIRLARYQFAFTASLKTKKYKDAIKIALRAGEETAGNERQQVLLLQNTDLFSLFETKDRVHELALHHSLDNGWQGSSTIYSTSLLSFHDEYKGEAISFLRLAKYWVNITLEKNRNKEFDSEKTIETEDIAELAYVYFNIYGIEKAGNFILKWLPKRRLFDITQIFVKRLLDRNLCNDVYKLLANNENDIYIILAIVNELNKIGQISPIQIVKKYFNKLKRKKYNFTLDDVYTAKNDDIIEAFISFLEMCYCYNLPASDIINQLFAYFPFSIARQIKDNYGFDHRYLYMRAVSLIYKLNGDHPPKIQEITPKEWQNTNTKEYDSDLKRAEIIITALLPIYNLRLETFYTGKLGITIFQKVYNKDSHNYQISDIIRHDYSILLPDLLLFCKLENEKLIIDFYKEFIKTKSDFFMKNLYSLLYIANRCIHLLCIRKDIEVKIYDILQNDFSDSSEVKANSYIRLSRAVFPQCKDDAVEYYIDALNEVSRFGDEITYRWRAITALGDKTADQQNEDIKIAYRFIRCAEIVGDTVAREKYWDRSKAISIMGKLSPPSALAALSRWRDRDVGWFPRQLESLTISLLENKRINSLQAWALNPFLEHESILSFAFHCLEYSQSINHRQVIADSVFNILRMYDGSNVDWKEFKYKTESFGHKLENIDEVINYYDLKKADDKYQNISYKTVQNDIDWNSVFIGTDFLNPNSFNKTLERFIADEKFSYKETFFQEALIRIKENDRILFLKQILSNETIDFFDTENIIKNIPKRWVDSISFKRYYPQFIVGIAKKFALKLCDRYYLEHFFEITKVNNKIEILEAIREGLSEYPVTLLSDSYFEYAELAAKLITPEEAKKLLDFALERMEMHISDDFGDEPWNDWLIPPNDIDMALAGLIWGALGSPRIKIRWQAAHVVRFLAESQCQSTIDALIKWLNMDQIGAFGCKRYPFYNLHARLYFFIACARISIDNPSILKPHSEVFSNFALFSMPHILIQKFTTDIAINIENAFPGTYKEEILNQLYNVGKSQFRAKKLEPYNTKIDSYLHKVRKFINEEKYMHGWDFDHYWFGPLGQLFGISENQVNELATEIIVSDWKIKFDGSYASEPRDIFRRYSHNDETQHSHGSYPEAEEYQFYLSYHSLFVVASNLLKNMPLVYHSYNKKFEEWEQWLHYHTLTKPDGKWLSDRRDHIPLLPYLILPCSDRDNWNKEYYENEFIDRLIINKNDDLWINVCAYWENDSQGLKENVSISSALVSPSTSQSLLHSWNSYDNPHDYKLPDFDEEQFEKIFHPFKLKGYIINEQKSSGIDDYDPFADGLNYPAYNLGELYNKILNLTPDKDLRFWYEPQNNIPVMECRIWNTGKERHSETSKNSGKYLAVSFNILKKLCIRTKMNIIFKVVIKRKKDRQEEKEDYGKERKRQTRLFLFSSDGRFRDARTYYKLR